MTKEDYRMKKRAFTLAETLVTLAIIGIVASLIMPSLRNSIGRDTKALSLARTVELFHNGIGEIFNEVQTKNMESTPPTELNAIQIKDIYNGGSEDYLTDGTNLMDEAQSLMGVEEVTDYNVNLIKNYLENEINGDYTKNVNTYRFKKLNSVVIFQEVPATGIDTASKDVVITRVLIDVNGNKAPNLLGNDVFLFGLTNNGHLIPAGAEAYNNNLFNETIDSYQTGCNTTITTGASCTARVMADGWKINY